MLYTDLLSEYNHIRGDKSNGRDFPPSIEADVAGALHSATAATSQQAAIQQLSPQRDVGLNAIPTLFKTISGSVF
jgi:hypothetical protein